MLLHSLCHYKTLQATYKPWVKTQNLILFSYAFLYTLLCLHLNVSCQFPETCSDSKKPHWFVKRGNLNQLWNRSLPELWAQEGSRMYETRPKALAARSPRSPQWPEYKHWRAPAGRETPHKTYARQLLRRPVRESPWNTDTLRTHLFVNPQDTQV